MKVLAKFFFRRISTSILSGCLLFFCILFGYKLLSGYSFGRQSIKNMIAKSVIGCMHAKVENQSIDCKSLLQKVETEVPELSFQIWTLDSEGKILWQNSSEDPPRISRSFGQNGSTYTLVENRNFFQIPLPVPSGYVDDIDTKIRVLVGEPLSGNSAPYLRNQVLAFVFALFLFGVLLSSFISFLVLSKRAKEAQRIFKSLSSGDLSARFKVGRLDELSELSSSFNKMVDLLAKSLQEVRESEVGRRALVGELSHDLRTPLTSMTSFVQILRNSEKLKEGVENECIDSLGAEIRYLNQLVGSLFELSQIESIQAKTDRIPVSITEILDEIENDFSVMSKMSAIAFSISNTEVDAWILGDAVLARRMLSNLIENSMRFARSKVHVSGRRNNLRKSFVIEIADDGPGFSEAMLANFGQVPAKRSVRADSNNTIHLGLGSVIAVKIAKLHDGEVYISNQSPSGAKIKITIPLCQLP